MRNGINTGRLCKWTANDARQLANYNICWVERRNHMRLPSCDQQPTTRRTDKMIKDPTAEGGQQYPLQ